MDTSTRYTYLNFNASDVVPTAQENRPLNDAQPVAVYMGRHADDIASEQPVAPATGLTLLARYDTAGDYAWTVPDLHDGKPYLVYVRMKGAGSRGLERGARGRELLGLWRRRGLSGGIRSRGHALANPTA